MKRIIIIAFLLVLLVSAPALASFRGFLQEDSGVTVIVGPFVQWVSANTPYTTSIAASNVFISKNGGAPAAKNDSGALSPSGASLGEIDRGFWDKGS